MNIKKFLLGLSAVATLMMSSFMAYAYTDITDHYLYKDAVDYVSNNGIANGYDDETFKPQNTINRAEFTKILIQSKLGNNPTEYAENCFTDVTATDWFASYVCYAKENGILNGYDDGSFKPGQEVNLVEAAKIIVNSFDIDTVESSGGEWYQIYIDTVGLLNYIPSTFSYLGQPVTRGEMAEMIWRVKEDIQDRAGKAAAELKDGPCQHLYEDIQDNIDLDRVRQAWLDWTNQSRANIAGLPGYTLNRQLDRTAIIWSEISKDRGYMDHKRPGQYAYYDYNMITQWFIDLGLVFQNVNRATHTENIGYGYFNCSETETDCTDALISSIRSTFDFFIGERYHSYRPHYNSIMKPEFNEIGVGVAIDKSRNRYYITIHYGTSIISDPPAICDSSS